MIGSSMIDWKAEGEVEVAVIKRPVPSNADLMPAHQTRQRIWIEGFSEKSEVISLLPQVGQMYPKSAQRHIRDGEKTSEGNTKTQVHFTAVILFKYGLGRGQKGASRIIDKS
jgi:hypothetical protein